jgi:integrase
MASELLTASGLPAKVKEAAARAAELSTRVRISDGNNLQLVVRENGTASWQLLVRINGTRKPVTLGRWPDVTLKRARDLCKPVRDTVTKGHDPIEVKRTKRRQLSISTDDLTVLKLFHKWLEKKRGSAVYMSNIQAAFTKDVLPAIGAKRPDEVQRTDIINILRKLEKRGALVMLRRVRMYLGHMYDFGLDAELVKASPVPAGQLKSFMEPKKGHFPAITNAAEIPALMKDIEGYEHTVVRTLMLLSAHLFPRPSEIRTSDWSQFDLEKAKWTIPELETKKQREHWVPLSPQVVNILKDYQGVVGDSGMLFPGRKYGQPVSEGTVNGALESLGYKGRHCGHGFRAMARTTIVEQLRIDAKYAEKQLAHETDESGLRGAYDRAEYWEDRVRMMNTWSDWLCAQTSAQQSSR